MRRNYLLYLEDIVTSICKILQYTGNASYEDFFKDEMRVDAIVRNFEIIGEASGNISKEIKDKYPLVEWRKISDFGVNYKIMWDIIKNKLPDLQKEIQSILEKEK